MKSLTKQSGKKKERERQKTAVKFKYAYLQNQCYVDASSAQNFPL